MPRHGNEERAYVVAYDIADRKRWRRVFRTMKGYGRSLQLSVFHCRLGGRRRAEMAMALESLVDPSEDHVVILDLGPADRVTLAVETIGRSFEPIERRARVF